MKVIIDNAFLLQFSFFCIVFSGSVVVFGTVISNIILYTGIFTVLATIFFNAVKNRNIRGTIYAFICSMISSYGLMIQDLYIERKIVLFISMIIIFFMIYLGGEILKGNRDLNAIRNGVLIGIFIDTLLALLLGEEMFDVPDEGIMSMGFKGGLFQKNYYGYTALVPFFISYIQYIYFKRKTSIIFLFITSVLLIISASRSAIILGVLFVVFIKFENFVSMIKKYKGLVSAFGIFCVFLLVLYVYNNIFINSTTFMYRIIGIYNLWTYIIEDMDRLFFGIADIAFVTEDYQVNIRKVVGFDGTCEAAIVGILVKNGLLGMVVYIITFLGQINKVAKWDYSYIGKKIYYALFLCVLFSMVIESLVIDIKFVFAPFVYLMVSSISGGKFDKPAKCIIMKKDGK